MKKIWITLFTLVSLHLFQEVNAQLIDEIGTPLRPVSAQRIIALTPALAELVVDLLEGETDRLVGVVDYTDRPATLRKKPTVGSFAAFNLERVAELRPDLILASLDGNPKERVLRLKKMGFYVVVLNSSQFLDIRRSIRQIASVLNRSKRGEAILNKMSFFLSRAKLRFDQKPKVMIQVGSHPLVVAGKNSFLSAALESIGAVNVYGDQEQSYLRPSKEDVLVRNPDWILILPPKKNDRESEKSAAEWNRFSSLKATKNRQIQIYFDEDLLRPSARIAEGVFKLSKLLRGAADE